MNGNARKYSSPISPSKLAPPNTIRDVRVQILDELRHRQAGHILIEGRGKSDNLVLAPIDRRHRRGQELWRGARGHLLEERDRMTALAGDLFEHRLEHPGIFGAFGVIAEQEIGEQPLAEERAFLTNQFVEGHPDLMGETHIEVMTIDARRPSTSTVRTSVPN